MISRPYIPDLAAIRAMVRRTRAEQGLPPIVEDPLALDRVAELVRPSFDERAAKEVATAGSVPAPVEHPVGEAFPLP